MRVWLAPLPIARKVLGNCKTLNTLPTPFVPRLSGVIHILDVQRCFPIQRPRHSLMVLQRSGLAGWELLPKVLPFYYTLEYQSCLCAGAFPHRVVVSQTNACQWNASFSDRSVSSRQMQLQSEHCRHCSKLNLFSVDAVGQDNGCHFYQTHSGRTANSDDIWIPGHQQVGRVKYFNVFDGQKQHSDLVRWLQTCVSQFESRNHSGALPDRSCIICQLKTKGIGQSGNFSVKNVELSVVEQFF